MRTGCRCSDARGPARRRVPSSCGMRVQGRREPCAAGAPRTVHAGDAWRPWRGSEKTKASLGNGYQPYGLNRQKNRRPQAPVARLRRTRLLQLPLGLELSELECGLRTLMLALEFAHPHRACRPRPVGASLVQVAALARVLRLRAQFVQALGGCVLTGHDPDGSAQSFAALANSRPGTRKDTPIDGPGSRFVSVASARRAGD